MHVCTSHGSPRHPATARRRGALLGGCALAACALLAGCAPKGDADAAPRTGSPGLVVRSGARYDYYDVQGTTAAELSASMRQARPPTQRSIGQTTWNVTWRTRWSGSPCRVTSADVRTTIVVSMPRWKAPPDAPPALVEAWNEMVRALSVHEAGHVEHAVVAEREIRRALLAVTAPSCSAMELQTGQVARRLLEEHRLRDRRYDERTRGGATQGAVWPPRSGGADSAAAGQETAQRSRRDRVDRLEPAD